VGETERATHTVTPADDEHRGLFFRFAERLTRHRPLFIGLTSVVVIAVLAGALRLEVDFSARAFFGSDGDETAALERFTKAFGPDDNVVLVVLERKDGTFVDAAGLTTIRQIARKLATVDGIDRVLAFTEEKAPVADEMGALVFRAPVPDPIPETPLALAALGARLYGDPLISPTFLAKDGHTAAIGLVFGTSQSSAGAHHIDTDDIGAVRALIERVEAAVAEVSLPPSTTTALAGMPVVRASLLGLILKDQFLFVPLSFGLMAVLLALLYRRFHGVLLPLFAAALPSALVMGVMGYVDEPIGVVNQVYFTLLPVIAVSGALHLLSRYYDEARRHGVDNDTLLPDRPTDAVIHALGAVGAPCFLSAATTMIGMSSLLLSSMPILRSFGLFSTIGVGFAFLTLIVPIPLILTVTRGRVIDGEERKRAIHTDRVLASCADISLGRPRWFIFGTVVMLAIALAIGQGVVVDTTLGGMLAPDHPTTKAGHVVDENLSGYLTLELDVTGPVGGFADPAALRALRDLETLARSSSSAIKATVSLATLAERIHEAVVGERTIPATRESAAQLLFLAEGNASRRDLVTDDLSRTRVQLRLTDVGAQKLMALADDLRREAPAIFSRHGLTGFVVEPTGTPLTTYSGVESLARDLKTSLFSAFFVIIALLSLALRSLRLGLIAILPNAMPITLGYALLAVMGWPLEPGPAVALVVALGIAVDDTIHLMIGTEAARKSGEPLFSAIHTAMVRCGRPVVFTTVILAAGFGVNALSSFPTNARVGVIGAFVIVVALLGDLFVLPPLLLLGARKDKKAL
jgi:predicted RND superfamily exporter protein